MFDGAYYDANLLHSNGYRLHIKSCLVLQGRQNTISICLSVCLAMFICLTDYLNACTYVVSPSPLVVETHTLTECCTEDPSSHQLAEKRTIGQEVTGLMEEKKHR